MEMTMRQDESAALALRYILERAHQLSAARDKIRVQFEGLRDQLEAVNAELDVLRKIPGVSEQLALLGEFDEGRTQVIPAATPRSSNGKIDGGTLRNWSEKKASPQAAEGKSQRTRLTNEQRVVLGLALEQAMPINAPMHLQEIYEKALPVARSLDPRMEAMTSRHAEYHMGAAINSHQFRQSNLRGHWVRVK